MIKLCLSLFKPLAWINIFYGYLLNYLTIPPPPFSTLCLIIFPFKISFKPNNSNFFSTSSLVPVKIYSNAKTQEPEALQDNKSKSGVYRWVNNINGKSYVGSAINLNKRFYEHYLGIRSNRILKQAIKKAKYI